MWRTGSSQAEDVPPRTQVSVELCFDRVQQFGHMLVLVDQNGWIRLNKPCWVVPYRRSRRRVVAVDHRAPKASAISAC